jgi:hypothetical protein
MVVTKVLGYTSDYVDKKLNDGHSFEQVKQLLTELGSDVETILSAIARKYAVKQTSEAQWGKYSLRYEEVIKLESVASLRREINVRRSNWESSPEYLTASKVVKSQKELDFENELRLVTDDLWKILHLGVNYLTAHERLRIKMSTEGFDKTDRLAYVTKELVQLRKAYLKQWRLDPDNFACPKPKS